VEKPAQSGNENGGNGSFPWWIILIVIFAILLIFIASLAVVEKTSFAFQTVLFKTGTPVWEDVLSKVQDQPGIRFTGLRRTIPASRRDLVFTLVKLEEEGNIRSVEDGRFVRFLPTVGSFVEGPLVLSENQVRIAKVLRDVRKVTYQELRDETGLSRRKLDRELSLMDLKGAISKKTSPQGDEYFMSTRQRKRISEWMEK
jgi:DNA-binding HxlR family transcriptional regulator